MSNFAWFQLGLKSDITQSGWTRHFRLNRTVSGLYVFSGSVESSVVRGLGLLSSTPGITVVGGFPSLLHLRALAPQKPVASSRQGTVEPQPPPHASSVVAWPIARQGFYGSQPTRYPGSVLSRGRSHSPHASATGSYDERP